MMFREMDISGCEGRLLRLVLVVLVSVALILLCGFAWLPSALAEGGTDAKDVAAQDSSGGEQAGQGSKSETAPKRYIDVVYDDSGSMETQDNIAWCEAHYAIEVFAAMLDKNDELRVFTMSDSEDFKGHPASQEPALTILGSLPSQERARLAHEGFSKQRTTIGTPFAAADNAYEDLKSKPRDSDRCLVILTDGEFSSIDNISTSDSNSEKDKKKRKAIKKEARIKIADLVQQRLCKWSDEGVRVRYLVLGDEQPVGFDSLKAAAQGRNNFSVRLTADESGGIIKGIVDECTQVFSMDEATEKYEAESGKFDINIPMKRIIVFAQGKHADIKKLEATSGDERVELDASSGIGDVDVAGVKHVDTPHPALLTNAKGEKWSPERIASRMADIERMRGEVVSFETDNGFDMKPGKLDIADAEDVTIYYVPYVDVELTMKDTKLFGKTTTALVSSNGNVTFSGAPLCDGEYQTTYKLLTKDGEDVTSKFEKMHSLKDCTLTDKSDGALINLCDGVHSFHEGDSLLHVNMTVGKKASISGQAPVKIEHRTWFDRLWLPILILIILALLAAFIIMELLKPRFPKLKPVITLDDGEDYRLSYRGQIENKIWPPWAPEKTFFTVKLKGDVSDSHDLRKRFQLAGKRIDLVAAKKKNGRRQLKLADQTIAMMEKHNDESFPDPNYSTLKRSFGRGGSFSFDGNIKHKRRGWINGANYTIRFS